MNEPIIHAQGDWAEGAVMLEWVAGGRRIVPQVERAIETAWAAASKRLGDKLFDGPMCRMEAWNASPDRLRLSISRTSYKPFLGTNLHNAHLADQFGADILANPIGLSAVVESADGWLLLGRRNDSVAYHPNRVHPFAGSLEPRDDLDVFADLRRELLEELSFGERDIADIRCIGLIEDRSLRQPELIFRVASTRSRAQIEATLDRREHEDLYAVAATRTDVDRTLTESLLTPVAVGSLMLWSRR